MIRYYGVLFSICLMGCVGCATSNSTRRINKCSSSIVTVQHAQNVLEVKVAEEEYINIENFLEANKKNVVAIGAEWCTPCHYLKNQVIKKAHFYPEINFVFINIVCTDVNTTGESPIIDRYVLDQDGSGELPFFLVYAGQEFKKVFRFEDIKTSSAVEDVIRNIQ